MIIRKKDFLKMISFIIVFVICITSLSQISLATTTTDENQFGNGEETNLASSMRTIMGKGLGVVQVVAAGTAVIVLLVLGIKFLLSGPEGKAVSKKAFVYYVIGFSIASMGTTIIGAIAKMIKSWKGGEENEKIWKNTFC